MLVCKCSEQRLEPSERNWEVHHFHCRYTVAGVWSQSDSSTIYCVRCGAKWRTKAEYVNEFQNHVAHIPKSK